MLNTSTLDQTEQAGSQPVHVEAEVEYIPPELGGRRTPPEDGYRGQFYYRGQDCDAVQTFPSGVEFGQPVVVRVWFANTTARRGTLYEGMPFLIREGPRTVGYGRITKLYPM